MVTKRKRNRPPKEGASKSSSPRKYLARSKQSDPGGLVAGVPQTKAPLTFDNVKRLVQKNKKSTAFTDECVISVCWKESSFDPSMKASTTTAKGLMQMTNPAVDTVNNNTPQGVHFEYSDMFDPPKAIQCGTYYLQIMSNQAGGDEKQALIKYGGVPDYADDVMQSENCLLTGDNPPMDCLRKIHPFEVERRKDHLIDNPTGESRFTPSTGS